LERPAPTPHPDFQIRVTSSFLPACRVRRRLIYPCKNEHMGRYQRLCELSLVIALLWLTSPVGRAQANTKLIQSGPDAQLREFRLAELEQTMQTFRAGPEQQYFAGMLANRTNHVADSVRLLSSAVKTMPPSRRDRAALAKKALADDFRKQFLYAKAMDTEVDLLSHYADQLKPDDIQGLKDDIGILRILRNAPAQTITWTSATHLKTERNPLQSLNVTLTVNGVQGPWLLDTGANLSVVSRSFAEQLGLKPLPGIAQGQSGLTGLENTVQAALLPTLAIGGATLHDVVVVIMNDANLKVGPESSKYQINAIIGYPVLRALGHITFLSDGYFDAGPTERSSNSGAGMYMDELSPVIECSVGEQSLPFYLDTGASGTNLFPAYYRRFHSKAKGWKDEQTHIFGAGGVVPRRVSVQPELDLGVGEKTAVLKNVKIYSSAADAPADYIYGNLGQDLFAGFHSFSLDFDTMRFRLGKPMSSTALDPR
jgi:hypothetical protein